MHSKRPSTPVILALLMAALAWYSVLAYAQDVPQTSATAIAAAVLPMQVKTPNGYQNFCSAVVVAPGTAYTAAHCVDEPVEMVLEQGGRKLRFDATRVPGRDLAVLTVPGLACPCAPIPPEGAGPIPLATSVMAIGYPLSKFRMTDGFLYGLLTVVDPQMQFSGVFLAFSARVDPGASGGALLAQDAQGRWWLVGILVAFFDHNGHRVSLAEPIS